MFKIPPAPLLGNSDTANTDAGCPSSVTPELPQISSTGSEPNQWSQQGPITGGQGQGKLHPKLCWCPCPALPLDAMGSRDICSLWVLQITALPKWMSLLFIINGREMRLHTAISACLERLCWLLRFNCCIKCCCIKCCHFMSSTPGNSFINVLYMQSPVNTQQKIFNRFLLLLVLVLLGDFFGVFLQQDHL